MDRTDTPKGSGTATLPPEVRQQLCQHVVGALNVIVVILDARGRITLFNRAAEQTSGYSTDEVSGRTPWDALAAPDEREPIREAFENLLQWGFPRKAEYNWRRRNGKPALIKWSYSVVRLEEGDARVLCTGVDLSDREALNNALQRRARALAYSNRELEAFTSSVSHDLRSPLRAMSGLSQMLLEDYGERLDSQANDYLRQMRASALRTTELVDSLLRLFKLSQQEIERVEVDLSALAESIIEELQAQEPERKVSVRIQPGMTVSADPRLMQVVLSNLIGNAWKYTRHSPNPTIGFGRSEEAGELVYGVQDNGAGFDMAGASELFKPFKRLHGDQEFEGTGIGLTLVERIIRSHGGRIWCESAVGKGARFLFTLR